MEMMWMSILLFPTRVGSQTDWSTGTGRKRNKGVELQHKSGVTVMGISYDQRFQVSVWLGCWCWRRSGKFCAAAGRFKVYQEGDSIEGSADKPKCKDLGGLTPAPELPTDSVSLVDVGDVIPLAACEASDTDADNEATYSFQVVLDEATNAEQVFNYEFTPERNGQDYEVLANSILIMKILNRSGEEKNEG